MIGVTVGFDTGVPTDPGGFVTMIGGADVFGATVLPVGKFIVTGGCVMIIGATVLLVGNGGIMFEVGVIDGGVGLDVGIVVVGVGSA